MRANAESFKSWLLANRGQIEMTRLYQKKGRASKEQSCYKVMCLTGVDWLCVSSPISRDTATTQNIPTKNDNNVKTTEFHQKILCYFWRSMFMMRASFGRTTRARCGSRITSSAARGKRACGKRDRRIAIISARSNRASATCLLQLDRRQSRIVYDPICSQWLRRCRTNNPRGASSGRAQRRAPPADRCLMRRARCP